MVLSEEKKNQTLQYLAKLISENQQEIITSNQKDLALAGSLDPTLVDRLKVDQQKVDGMVAAIEEVISLKDPQGKLLSSYDHPNGMKVENRVVPFGKILIIYESRPDVTIEAAISAFKAGNKILLKGGKEAKHSNLHLVDLWKKALFEHNISSDFVNYLDVDRTETQRILKENPHNVNLIIPRGGDSLINYVKDNTDIPVIVSGRGNNFVYVHDDADFEMASSIILNGKTRLSVCNATDKVLFNESITDLDDKLVTLINEMFEMKLEVYGDGETFTSIQGVSQMPSSDMYDEEFLSPKIMLGSVASMEEGIDKINKHSGGHSAVIVTGNQKVAEHFQQEVDCAAVYHNASTRFTDGGQFGFGAEMAISTQKLHFRGPIGLGQLVTNKWFIAGSGQIR
ncbi:MAG: glutamate-5-semialdehyde dehydrogenase [Cyclobacteriaceae bacterium]